MDSSSCCPRWTPTCSTTCNSSKRKERSWFDIPIVYANSCRAILAMEKGAHDPRVYRTGARRLLHRNTDFAGLPTDWQCATTGVIVCAH